MKRFIVLVIVICLIAASCTKSPESHIETANTPLRTQKFVGRFKENVSLHRDFEDKIVIEKEQGEGFDIYSLDIMSPIIKFEYEISPQNNLLYKKQLDADRVLMVKQLGNGEENNVLVLEGKTTRNIAKKIAYSESALVSTSPSQKYIVYCAAEDILNRYGLYIYDVEKEQTLQLTDTVDEELLNDLERNIAWSPDDAYVVVSNRLVFKASDGRLIREINGESVIWSAMGRKLAYVKSEGSYGKSIFVLDLSTAGIEQVFIVNQNEYLPGYIVWDGKETKLAFVTALTGTAEEQSSINPYHAIYSLDLTTKEATRIDTILKLDPKAIQKLENIQYNASGSILAITIANHIGCDLYIYNINTGASEYSINIEYLHYENNESYVCSSGEYLYYIQGQHVVELDANMDSRLIYRSEKAIEDIYISKSGSSMIIIEKSIDGIVFRQLENFSDISM